jgi:hypothetical protein
MNVVKAFAVHTMKAYNSALDGKEWSASCSNHIFPGKNPGTL